MTPNLAAQLCDALPLPSVSRSSKSKSQFQKCDCQVSRFSWNISRLHGTTHNFMNDMSGAKRKGWAGASELANYCIGWKFWKLKLDVSMDLGGKIPQDRLGLQSNAFALLAVWLSLLGAGLAWSSSPAMLVETGLFISCITLSGTYTPAIICIYIYDEKLVWGGGGGKGLNYTSSTYTTANRVLTLTLNIINVALFHAHFIHMHIPLH